MTRTQRRRLNAQRGLSHGSSVPRPSTKSVYLVYLVYLDYSESRTKLNVPALPVAVSRI